jgi:alpha-beta hydrolase superfamily lysophospholipase
MKTPDQPKKPRLPRTLLIAAGAVIAAMVAALGGMIAFGTSDPPPPLASVAKPFESVDFSDLPTVQRIPARDGSAIAFRAWGEQTGDPPLIVVAIHGSSATSVTLHPLGKALGAQGLPVYAPDIRGHGDTGRRGDIDHPGELDDDLADFVAAVKARHPQAQLVLLGFSSGGGFALHVAASPLGKMFARAVLLSPMLGVAAPTFKPTQEWAKPFIPRIIALALLDRVGLHAFDHLTVLVFAVAPAHADLLTTHYSFALMRAFATADYAADLRAAQCPIAVLVGEKDELFDAGKFAPTIAAIRHDVPVTVIPGLNHIEIATDGRAVPAIVAAVRGVEQQTQ